jgi:hypothetical protein
LAKGTPPAWCLLARCLSEPSLVPLTFSKPQNGRFELLVPVPDWLDTDRELEFEVRAAGPEGKILLSEFVGVICDPPEPRKVKMNIPEDSLVRRPPYRLVYIKQDEYRDQVFWQDDEDGWSTEEAGCFHEPTDTMPLTLVINEDFHALSDYRLQMTGGIKKLDPSTLARRVTRYTSHVAYHLYRMYMDYRGLQDASKGDSSVEIPRFSQLKAEVNRVSVTLLKMMEVAG